MTASPKSSACPFGPDDRLRFAYSELEPSRAAAVRAHLSGCPQCTREIAELARLAGLTRKIAAQPDPLISWRKRAPRRADQSGRPGWFSLATALATAAVAGLVFMLLPGRESLRPGPTAPPRALSPATAHAVTALALERVEFAQPVRILRAGSVVAQAAGPAELRAGDRIEAEGNEAHWTTPDGDRLALGSGARVRLVARSGQSTRWELTRGWVDCRVALRSADQHFSVQAGPGLVTVHGTRFVVRLDPDGRLRVGVREGRVALSPSQGGAGVELEPGQQGALRPGGSVTTGPLDEDLRSQLGWSAVAPPNPATPAYNRPAAAPARSAQPSKPGPIRTGSEPPAALPAPAPTELTAELLAESLARNTNWMFDGIRSDIAGGRGEDALRKLGNYLGDPQSPDRDEATFLKAVCLERLDRGGPAVDAYQLYLERWPSGPRAAEARAGLVRLR